MNIYHYHWPRLSNKLLFEENLTYRNNVARFLGFDFATRPSIHVYLSNGQLNHNNLVK